MSEAWRRLRSGSWWRCYGDWWMLQGACAGWLSFGLHLDFRRRQRGDGLSYGPYLDLHLGCLILSLGWRPVYAGEIELHTSTAIWRNR